MSECVVRMEMPQNCFECPFSIIDDTADGAWCNALAQQIYHDKDEDCPIICQLPEGHGRLVDADALKDYLVAEAASYNLTQGQAGILSEAIDMIDEQPTIVPAEAERSET